MKNENLKASFIIPTKNNAKTIEQCLRSVLAYRKYIQDIVVVDGNSTDGTLDIVRKFQVDKILADPGKGQNLAYEIGWRASEGDLIVFMDGDAFLGDGFFPTIYQYFDDEKMGIVGCPSRAPVSCNDRPVARGLFLKTVSQWEEYAHKRLLNPRGLLQIAYRFTFVRKGDDLPPCGPCQVVRRNCLEAFDGYRGVSLKLPTDAVLAARVIMNGGKSCAWLNSPVRHYPRSTIKELMGEAYRWGRERRFFQRDPEFKSRSSMFQGTTYILGSLASPFIGVMLALRFGNPWHIMLFPLTRYTSLVSYLRALWAHDTGEKVP